MKLQKIIIVIAILMIMAGISNKDYLDLMNKSIRICFECIGIG